MLTTRARGAQTCSAASKRQPVQAVEDDVDRPGRREQPGRQVLAALAGPQLDDGVRAEGEQSAQAQPGRGRRRPPGRRPSRCATWTASCPTARWRPAPAPSPGAQAGVLDQWHVRRGAGVADGRGQHRVEAVGQRQQVLVGDEDLRSRRPRGGRRGVALGVDPEPGG